MSSPSGASPDLVARMLGGVAIDAEIDLQIDDGAGGASGGRVAAAVEDGVQVVRVDVDRPAVALAALPRALPGGLAGARDVARRYGDTPWRVEIHGPRGLLAAIDPARRSRLARALTGSPHVRVHPLAATAGPTGAGLAVAVLVGLALVAVGATSGSRGASRGRARRRSERAASRTRARS